MTENKDNGGPAFPVQYSNEADGPTVMPSDGMSLRDYFAAKAMQACPMPQGHMHDVPEVYARIASHAYKMADAMLEARK